MAGAKRKKKKTVSREQRLRKWMPVDDKLKKLGEVEREITMQQTGFKDRVHKAETEFNNRIQPLVGRKIKLETDIENTFKRRAPGLKPHRSIKLPHGIIGYKKNPKRVKTLKSTLKRIFLHETTIILT